MKNLAVWIGTLLLQVLIVGNIAGINQYAMELKAREVAQEEQQAVEQEVESNAEQEEKEKTPTQVPEKETPKKNQERGSFPVAKKEEPKKTPSEPIKIVENETVDVELEKTPSKPSTVEVQPVDPPKKVEETQPEEEKETPKPESGQEQGFGESIFIEHEPEIDDSEKVYIYAEQVGEASFLFTNWDEAEAWADSVLKQYLAGEGLGHEKGWFGYSGSHYWENGQQFHLIHFRY